MRKNVPQSRLTKRQVMTVLAARAVQKSVKGVTFGKIAPLWSLPLAIHFINKNRELDCDLENSESIDTEPDPASLVCC